MKKITTFESEDGKKFDDGIECAKYELSHKPEVVALLNEKFKQNSRMDYWCEAGPCGCLGCANGTFYNLSLEKEHWEAWVKYFLTLTVELKSNLYCNKEMQIKVVSTNSMIDLAKFVSKNVQSELTSISILMSLKKDNILFRSDSIYVINCVEDILKKYPEKLHYIIVNTPE